jgi:two-component system NtrC family sensor kinase
MTRQLADAQRQLTQADKLASVGRLAAGLAHEINNPLTGVLTYASFLEKRAGDNPEVRADLEVIVRETKRCREIVRGLLDFARQSPPERRPTDLNEVVRHGVAIVMNQLALGRVSLQLDLAADLAPVPVDGNQIQQVIVNLMLNAADAIGERGGTIQVTTRAVGDATELTVEDSGAGIPEEAMDHLFEPFFTTKGSRGNGLGLAVTWRIVESHGGTIQVESKVGKGTRFAVRLPYAVASAA